MSNIFQNLELQAFRAGITPRTKESREWFRKKVSSLKNINREALMKEDPLKQTTEEIIGSMYMFSYDPKHKETLPYYDTFPLVVVVGPAEGGFYGLNLHYLPPILRAKMLDALMDITTNKKYNDSTRFKMSYELLAKTAKLKYFKPCFKHYLNEHVKSKFAMVPAPEWEIATFLPTANFQKASTGKVYKDSRGMIGS
ncbi:DNA end protector [Phage C48C1]|nr:DNA end protector [Phage C48C1]